ncbi:MULTISPECIES: winged helix-turn-helix domain-containing protein [Streptomyces]|uniref:Winged helix-turn-helix domain-containing protein n=2 Tax=Streptomyces rimosus subsp. rimosus TaxID=132474 RepID=A0A8A1UTR8_STRR1|nr:MULTISPECIES: crosslink repair DNA glycosylase YcaQ family protein [Streptomyces]KOG78091.1 cytoplasmic protein [Kitasatospora aureofaciens]MYT42657.1 winged helix-turn-helix domain-containing protein [Streptomyces sp. SID5471]KOT44274.1 cytoplasmic protein [Streptomyces rimosus subsp. rimosus]KOT45038.1 cytoplasmic protein [Streptomyces sp. NRRL WC-3701]KOT62176.1 cytoplasmic protein [Streptomyces rimosus subsp. rimosus]
MTAATPAKSVTPKSATPKPVTSLSADDARRIALRAQGFLGAPDRRAGVRGVLRRLGAVQLDTISVLARSHELIPYARLGAVGRPAVESAYWSGGHSFEYWSHAACILPVEEWPHFAFRRRAMRAKGYRWHLMEDREGSCAAVLDRLKADGPLTTSDLGGGRKGGEWWDWSETKIAVEWLLDTGEVVCTERRGWKRVYDLAERAIPDDLLHDDLDDAECMRRLVAQAGAALGVATRADLADYHRLKNDQVDAVIADSGLVPVEVAGWGRPAWADPAALADAPRGRHRTTLLSPFDSLIWDRPRTARIFDFTHRLEAYVPRAKRIHGYFAMPLLTGGRLAGRVDPAREGSTLIARQVSMRDAKAVRPMAQALAEAARWVGCDTVRIERCDDAKLRAGLVAELSEV